MKRNSKESNSKSTWIPVGSKHSGTVAYMEMFEAKGRLVAIPGVSRWIDGPVLDLSKAYLPEE